MSIETTPCVMCGYTLLVIDSETQVCVNCNTKRIMDATEWCEKTAMEIHANSALPYPFPVDSEIYDH